MNRQSRSGPSPPSLYKIKHAPGKGLGAFALNDIPRGARLTCEKPLVTALREPGYIDPVEVYEAFEKLRPEGQKTYLQLSASQIQVDNALQCMDDDLPLELKQHVANVASIFESNAFNMRDEGPEGSVLAGIFPLAARFNHDCTPNVAQTWNQAIGSLTIHAIRDIKVGEELCDSYVPLCEDQTSRQVKMGAYGFVCKCAVCDGSYEVRRASEKRRVMARRLEEDLAFLADRIRPSRPLKLGPLSPSVLKNGQEDALNVVEYLEQILKEEGLVGHDLGRWYSFASWYCTKRFSHDLSKRIEWQEKVVELYIAVKGRDHEESLRAERSLADLRKKQNR